MPQRTQSFLPRDLGMIVSFAEVGEHHVRCAPVVLFTDEFSYRGI
jgi:hypothetical protein